MKASLAQILDSGFWFLDFVFWILGLGFCSLECYVAVLFV